MVSHYNILLIFKYIHLNNESDLNHKIEFTTLLIFIYSS